MKQPINDLLTVDIFGSCISRDVLEFCNTEEVSVGQYVARSSFVSSVAPRPDVILAEDEINLSSNFQRRCVLRDVNKTTLDTLKENKGDFLMVDFFEERFPVTLFRGTIVTQSSEFQNAQLMTPSPITWR